MWSKVFLMHVLGTVAAAGISKVAAADAALPASADFGPRPK
jgi:hypothetical protein